MPLGRRLVVLQHWKVRQNYFLKVTLDSLSPLRRFKSCATKPQFVPDYRRNCHITLVLVEVTHDTVGWVAFEWLRNDIGVKQVLHNSQSDIPPLRFVSGPREQFIRIKCEIREIHLSSEFPIRCTESRSFGPTDFEERFGG